MVTIRIWDLPTRLFHWLLVTSFIMAWLSQGDDRYLVIHVFAGYLFLGLLIFRLIWGFIGSDYARFRSFCFGYTAVWDYLKHLGHSPTFLGHNPAGSWAIFALLTLGLIVSATGLLTLGGEERHGPLAGMLSFAWGERYHAVHELTAWLMLALVGIHIIGVGVASRLHRQALVKAMITGFKSTATQQPGVSPHRRSAIMMLSVIVLATLSYFQGYLIQEQPYLPFKGPQLAENALWQQECSDCHLAYHPTLLPQRSWQRLLAQQAEHFGEDLFLETEMLAELEHYATTYAAETALTEPAWKLSTTIPAQQTPIRITATEYWRQQHQNIAVTTWEQVAKFNCDQCHFDAQQGSFEDSAMRIPDFSSEQEEF